MRKSVTLLLALSSLTAAWAAPDLVVGDKQNLTIVHLSTGQNLVVQIEPILKNDPKPGRKWSYLGPRKLPKHLKFLGESQQGKLQVFRFQCLGAGDEMLRLPLCTLKDGVWDGPATSFDLGVVSP